MDRDRIPTNLTRPSDVCPMCRVNPAPPVTFGERHPGGYVCDDCRDEGQRRADETMAAIEAMRAVRERRTDD